MPQIVEKASVLRLQSGPLRLATCNLHGLQTEQGVTALVKEVRVRQYITSNFPLRDEIQWTLFLGDYHAQHYCSVFESLENNTA